MWLGRGGTPKIPRPHGPRPSPFGELLRPLALQQGVRIGLVLHGRIGLVLHGRIGLVLHGRIGLVLHGRRGLVLHGRIGLVLHGRIGLVLHGRIGLVLHGRRGLVLHGRRGLVLHGRRGLVLHGRRGLVLHLRWFFWLVPHDGTLLCLTPGGRMSVTCGSIVARAVTGISQYEANQTPHDWTAIELFRSSQVSQSPRRHGPLAATAEGALPGVQRREFHPQLISLRQVLQCLEERQRAGPGFA